MTSRRRRPEQNDQIALVKHLQLRATSGTYWFHPANGGARTAIEGAILRACGVRAGTPDIICIRGGRTYALELKSPSGRLTPAQIAAHEEMRAAGAEVVVAVGLNEAIQQLERWNLLKGTASTTPIAGTHAGQSDTRPGPSGASAQTQVRKGTKKW